MRPLAYATLLVSGVALFSWSPPAVIARAVFYCASRLANS